MEEFAAGLAYDALIGLVNSIQSIIDDYGNAPDNAKMLKSRCEEISDLLEYFKQSKSPADRVINDIKKETEQAEETIEDFKKKINYYKNGSTIKRPVYFVKRTYHTVDYSRQFMDHAEKMDQLLNRLRAALKLTKELLRPSALAYEKDMNKECMEFWIEMCGTSIHCEKTSWPLFISKYQQKYGGPLDIELKTRIKATALVEGDVLTLFGYMQLINLCDFPLKKEKLPPLLDCNSTISQADLIKVSEIVSNLINDFSSNQMNDYIVTVIQWYKNGSKKKAEKKQDDNDSERTLGNCDNSDENGEKKKKSEEEEAKERQKRANECYIIIKLSREGKNDELTLEQKSEERHAFKVDEARRHISLFYQRFMALCAIGQLSREVFKKVDFPGKSRMKTFIRDYLPLDYANYHIVINPKSNDREWEAKKPNVYKFLEEFIAEIKKEENAEKSEKDENVEISGKNESTEKVVETMDDSEDVKNLGIGN
ncbi:unnamed protein product [Cunninghamella echinulata]